MGDRSARLLLLLATLLSFTAASGREPIFEARALGVLGGDDERNLSCYLLGRVGAPAALMIDAGSITQGVVTWKRSEGKLSARSSFGQQAAAVKDVLGGLQAVLVTHSHFDHLAGFTLSSPMLIGIQRPRPLEIIGLPETIEALRAHVLASPVWVDLTSLPPNAPVAKYVPLASAEVRRLA